MNKGDVLGALVQVAIALIASGLAVKLLTLRQDRRKIAGDASTQEANAASTLSGAALQMVESAQKSARESDTKANEAKSEVEKLWVELNRARWKVFYQQRHIDVLEQAMRDAGIAVPVAPLGQDVLEDMPTGPPPDAAR